MYRDFQAEPAVEPQGDRRVASPAGKSGLLQRILREPLTHFVIVGALIFGAVHVMELRSQRYTVHIGAPEMQRIATAYEQQYGIAPTPDQMRTMIDNYVREEIFLREGTALGLDRNDEIVRRRIAQKYEFLQQDMAVPRDPTEAELRGWYASHRKTYVQPSRRSFDQRYFAIDQRGEAAARALAQKALADGGTAKGDIFPGPDVIRLLSEADMGRVFGGELATRAFAAPIGTWIGPVRSGFGWHILRVTEAAPAQTRSFEAAIADVRADWREIDRIARNRARYAALLANYRVTIGDK